MSSLDIDAATWARLNSLLDAALELPAAARMQWVESLGAEFAALKPQLLDLLSRAATVETGDFLNTIPKIAATEEASNGAISAAGEVIGAYRLVRELGVGGMPVPVIR